MIDHRSYTHKLSRNLWNYFHLFFLSIWAGQNHKSSNFFFDLREEEFLGQFKSLLKEGMAVVESSYFSYWSIPHYIRAPLGITGQQETSYIHKLCFNADEFYRRCIKFFIIAPHMLLYYWIVLERWFRGTLSPASQCTATGIRKPLENNIKAISTYHAFLCFGAWVNTLHSSIDH